MIEEKVYVEVKERQTARMHLEKDVEVSAEMERKGIRGCLTQVILVSRGSSCRPFLRDEKTLAFRQKSFAVVTLNRLPTPRL